MTTAVSTEPMDLDDSSSTSRCSFDEDVALVQHDWHKAVKEQDDSFFVGSRSYGLASEFRDVRRGIDGYAVERPGETGLAVKIEENTLTVTTPSVSTVFLAPSIEYGGIHRHPIASLAVSSSGNLFLSTSTAGHLRVSNVLDGTTLREFEGHLLDVNRCRFFPSGLVALSAGMDLTVRIWSVETGACVRELKGHTQAVTDCHPLGVGREVLSCGKDGTVRRWNVGEAEETECWRPEAGICHALAVSHDGTRFAVACELNSVVVYSLDGGEKLATLPLPSPASCVSFGAGSNAQLFAGDDSGTLSVFDVDKGALCARLRTSRGRVEYIEHRQEGLYAAFHDGTVALYDSLSSPHAARELSGSDCDPIYALAFHGDHVYTAGRDAVVRKYRV